MTEPQEQIGGLRDRIADWLPVVLVITGLTGTVLVSAAWVILNRPEPVVLAAFGSLVSGGLMTVALQEVKGLRDDVVKDRRRSARSRKG